ncbi:MAG: 3-hydroxyacyl-CoA dehydrogenase family protein [Burkholderiaceae bacterium]|jgi:3-hydroxybutyryl-CoA dehydrogenase|nr:3-hydroxyacyl-CoA dehydrogenase family protein [Burkholderiaceae bacterium]
MNLANGKKETIAVVGGGLMGAGIATKFALAGHAVVVIETDSARSARVLEIAAEILDEIIAAGAATPADKARALALLTVSNQLEDVAPARWVIEAIPEVLDSKRDLYARLEAILPPEAVIASNTSSFPPDQLVQNMRRRERFVILHFWNPPHVIPLVEIVPAAETDPALVDRAVALLRAIGAEPVALKAAIPGFIGNRLQFAVLREALHIVRSGAATPEQVDAVMRASLGRRYSVMGPLEGADLGGLHTFLSISKHLMPKLARDEGAALELLAAHVDKEELGASTGQGFYHWDAARRARIKQAFALLIGKFKIIP